MPALMIVAALAILFKIFPFAAFLSALMWLYLSVPVVESICRELGSCRELGREGLWVVWISLLPPAFPALCFAWKWWTVVERRRMYLNLFILAVGVPAAIIFGIASGTMPEPD
jgi:hypothetical protein